MINLRQILENRIKHLKEIQQKGKEMSDFKISHGLKTRVSSRSITVGWQQLLISRFCEKLPSAQDSYNLYEEHCKRQLGSEPYMGIPDYK